MKAIDFACNLLKTMGESDLSTACVRVLFCIAAGLHYKEEINHFLNKGNISGNVSNTLKRLEAHKLISLIDHDTELYRLTTEGKESIARLLHFLPHPRH